MTIYFLKTCHNSANFDKIFFLPYVLMKELGYEDLSYST